MGMVYWKKGRVDEAGLKLKDKWVAVIEPHESADGRKHWVTIGIPEPNGRPTKKGEQAAQAWLQNHLQEQLKFKAAGVVPTPDKTVKAQCADYLEARKLGEKSREYGILEQFQAFKIGNSTMGSMLLTAVTSEHVQAYLNSKREIRTARKDGKFTVRAASPGNPARHRITLAALFSSAENQKPNPLIPRGSNPVAGTVTDEYEDRRHRELKQEEQDRMEPFLHDEQHCPGLYRLGRIITFALYSLMRKEEIFRVRWRDISLTEHRKPDGSLCPGVITVASEGEEQTKSRETRKVDLWPELKELLLVMRAEAMQTVIGLPKASAIEDRHVFLSADGTPYKSIKVVWGALKRKAGIKNLKFHDLRRTGAMRYRRLGVDLEIIQSMLGHGDIETTMRYLGKVGDEQARGLNRAWARKQELAQAAVAAPKQASN